MKKCMAISTDVSETIVAFFHLCLRSSVVWTLAEKVGDLGFLRWWGLAVEPVELLQASGRIDLRRSEPQA